MMMNSNDDCCVIRRWWMMMMIHDEKERAEESKSKHVCPPRTHARSSCCRYVYAVVPEQCHTEAGLEERYIVQQYMYV